MTCDHEWEEADIECDICGSHNALFCRKCLTFTDLTMEDDPRAL